ncbi:HAD family hydrolase [Azomonas macrocytogenes]|uniref:HAD superfamily hydrolase (TIGR01509 family) n=1 Tax=Azomonas macrocytogenes TaxID=69962 RepID=A0A839SZL4_AZOMA|nr:HAD family hydrolase [Azomonas macrocytogenes]MBB3102767.1 HAD superfamily hydrolase (TIGR01509 family) [Azomonas macrocytogenes]
MKLANVHHWVFDMDGTLTIATHDFPAIRRALEIPAEADILSHLAALPEVEAAPKRHWLLEHERELARAARPAPGACELLQELCARGYRLGMLTRNAHELAVMTLKVVGLDHCFASDDILGRDEALPKPDPCGLLHLARKWNVTPSDLVMVGDFRNDLECARAAGAYGILVNTPENLWPELADLYVRDCAELKRLIG